MLTIPTSIPLFYFPTTILFVDDDPMVIKLLKKTLDLDFTVKLYYKPNDILAYFENYESPLSKKHLINSLWQHEFEDTPNHTPVDLDTIDIMNLSKAKELKSEVTILVSDYSMPEMNGLELCEKIKVPFLKKVLLTSTTDYQVAVEALNKKTIDCYINKDRPNTKEDLVNYVNGLANRFFHEITEPLKNHLEVKFKLPISDSAFIKFFNEIIKTHSIKEYYLIDKNGSFLLINDEGEEMTLIVHTDRSLNEFIDTYTDDVTVANYIQLIANRKKIPYFGPGLSGDDVDPITWYAYMYEPKLISGKENFYCTLINHNAKHHAIAV